MSDMRPKVLAGSVRRCVQFVLLRDGWFSAREFVPNFFTLLSICAGLLAIRWALERQFEWALGAILVAAILDGIDGRMARMLHAQSKFGAEFDSLADFVSFGVAPAILLFNWSLMPLEGVGWTAVTALTLACGVRLARFNANIERKRSQWEQDYLTGVPAPAGAIIAMLPLYLDGLRAYTDPPLAGFADHPWASWAIVAYTVTIAFLMISTIPTFAGKMTGDRLLREHPIALIGVVAGLLWLLLIYPYSTLAAGTLLYLCTIPLGVWRFIQLSKPGAGDDQELDVTTYPRNAGE